MRASVSAPRSTFRSLQSSRAVLSRESEGDCRLAIQGPVVTDGGPHSTSVAPPVRRCALAQPALVKRARAPWRSPISGPLEHKPIFDTVSSVFPPALALCRGNLQRAQPHKRLHAPRLRVSRKCAYLSRLTKLAPSARARSTGTSVRGTWHDVLRGSSLYHLVVTRVERAGDSRRAPETDHPSEQEVSPVLPSTAERATLWEVARRAGVHAATASRALNDATRQLVAPDTLARVLKAARELDYRPNHAARSLRTQRSMTVGVVIPDIMNSLFPPIVRGIEDFLAPAGYVALVANTGRSFDRERVVLDEMLARSVEGIVLATARRDYPILTEAAFRNVPIVLVNRVTDDGRYSSVSTDDRLGARLAVAHLLELGHRLIAHIAGPRTISTGFGRRAGYLDGLRDAGIRVSQSLLVAAESYAEEEGYRCARALIDRGASFTAILAANDMLALGALRALSERTIRCPEDCSLIGFNDMPFVDRVSPPLTTVRLPQYDAGGEAARLLLDRIRTPSSAVRAVLLAPQLVVRQSTCAPITS